MKRRTVSTESNRLFSFSRCSIRRSRLSRIYHELYQFPQIREVIGELERTPSFIRKLSSRSFIRYTASFRSYKTVESTYQHSDRNRDQSRGTCELTAIAIRCEVSSLAFFCGTSTEKFRQLFAVTPRCYYLSALILVEAYARLKPHETMFISLRSVVLLEAARFAQPHCIRCELVDIRPTAELLLPRSFCLLCPSTSSQLSPSSHSAETDGLPL